MDYIITGIEWDIYFEKNRIFCFCDHIGRHLGFLSSPSVMPIYAGSFRNYKHYRTFWYITHLVLWGGGGGSGFPNFLSWLSPYQSVLAPMYIYQQRWRKGKFTNNVDTSASFTNITTTDSLKCNYFVSGAYVNSKAVDILGMTPSISNQAVVVLKQFWMKNRNVAYI